MKIGTKKYFNLIDIKKPMLKIIIDCRF